MLWHHMGCRPLHGLGAEAAMCRIEEGPVEMILAHHDHFPSKRGVCFATNAWYARWKSADCMQIACAVASASIASSIGIAHSRCNISLVMACANVGPSASLRA